jgi:biopolymer transport protein ExbD
LLLPLTAILLFEFSEKKEIPIGEKAALETTLKLKNYVDSSSLSASKKELLKFNALAKKYNAIPVEKRKIPMDDLKTLETIYGKMNEEQKKVAQPFPECLPQNQKRVELVEININNNGQLLVQDEPLRLEDLKTYLSKLNKHLSFDERKKIVRSIIKVDTKTPKEVIQKVDKILTEYGSATINILGPEDKQFSKVQQNATREEMKEYNTLAKKYNEMDRNHMVIKNKEVQRLKELYGKMSEKQQSDAEPFPNFPPPPPAPKAPEPPKNVSDTDYAANQIETIIEKQDPYDVVSGNIGVTQPKQPEPVLPPTYINETNPNLPPTPPTPLSPIESIEKWTKEGADFRLNGKPISAEKVLEVVKNNDRINIDLKESTNKKTLVKLSVDPIHLKN